MTEAKAQFRLKLALQHQYTLNKEPHILDRYLGTRTARNIVNNRTGEFVVPLTELHNDERSKIEAIDQIESLRDLFHLK